MCVGIGRGHEVHRRHRDGEHHQQCELILAAASPDHRPPGNREHRQHPSSSGGAVGPQQRARQQAREQHDEGGEEPAGPTRAVPRRRVRCHGAELPIDRSLNREKSEPADERRRDRRDLEPSRRRERGVAEESPERLRRNRARGVGVTRPLQHQEAQRPEQQSSPEHSQPRSARPVLAVAPRDILDVLESIGIHALLHSDGASRPYTN